MKKNLLMALALLPAFLGAASAALPECPDIPSAMKTAAEQNRDIMWLFTGNDWCPSCIYLESRIMNQPAFDEALGSKLVLVKVLFPRTPEALKGVTDEQMAARLREMDSMKITAFPTAVLVDEKGLPYALVQGAERNVEGYVTRVKEALANRAKRDEALAKAEGLEGMERAKALAAALETVPENLRGKYVQLIAEIESLDSQNTLGYNGTVQRAARQAQQKDAFRKMIEGFAGKLKPAELAECRKQVEAFMADNEDMTPEMRQSCYQLIAEGYALSRDYEKSYEFFCKALDAAPDSEQAQKMLIPIKENFEQNVLPALRGQQAAQQVPAQPVQK